LRFASIYGYALAVFTVFAYVANHTGSTPGDISFLAYMPGLIVGVLAGIVCARANSQSYASIPANIFTTFMFLWVALVAWWDSLVFVW
jgi:hypothetical protein